ncbi:heavy metal-associated isoprenylated plant protein 4-like [Trifolium pratense]|uniref:heavy metal-associated isoprenylated plant protein 4-like n=1 Tax=Trifolium pratense TaxID=57577 RepID=UPI001E693400|nr:heavy metal-associated isoprenylated plant protein 4-like [Trifolium pratense]
MTGGKEEKKDEKGKAKIEEKVEKKKDEIELITAIYKLNLHCQECGNKIKKHLLTTQGVQTVEMHIEKGEIKAKGKLDPLKILKLIEKKSNRKVELISPKVKPKEITTIDKKPKETKDPIVRTITVKVHMHCDKCEADLKRRLIKHKGIFNVKTDKKAQSLIVEGTIEVEKLTSFLRKRVNTNAEVISIKEEKKEEKKEKGKEEKKEEKGKEGKSSESTKVIEIHHHGNTQDEIKIKDNNNVPYIIHYVYAPQIFSDENPNSCSIS